ncbi:GNAT family N-acetyltransferase [Actinokineospora inagensis]|uniref:GNAT family N-acetyltransferase n=1 Tax=Actinokineospora inagensis TaxID=103730 RepID=UPI00041EB5F0|nr:GNAT family N-acetyltransferase [Actinokineospora inagensis]
MTQQLDIAHKPADSRDVPRIAGMLTQLYREEAPGMINGDTEPNELLVHRALREQAPAAIEGMVVVEDAGTPVAIGAIATRQHPRVNLWYDTIAADARDLLGPRDGTRFLNGMRRLMGALITPLAAGEAQLHSIVVDREARQLGAGAHVVAVLEEKARLAGKDSATLQVLNGNPAQHFYAKLGYEVTHVDAPTDNGPYPSITMTKPLYN